MGVRHLQTYLENFCPDACYNVDIKSLIEEYKRRQLLEEVVIVVDGLGILNRLYDDLAWVTGGQFKEFTHNVKNFVESFRKLGAKLVIFFDGPTIERKRSLWITRRINSLEKVNRIFDALYKGYKTSQIDRDLFLLPTGITTRFLFKYILHCEVKTSIGECDEEVAKYARENQCFAILGQDTDYVILDGAEYYLSMSHLNMKTMTTLNYDRKALARRLHITPYELPLLASLMGNDIVSFDDLKPFHNRIVNGKHYLKKKNLIPWLGEFIQRLVKNGQEINYPFISCQVFGEETKANMLWNSIQSYSNTNSATVSHESSGNAQWDRVVECARRRHINSEQPPAVWGIMVGLPFEQSTGMEDFRVTDLLPAMQVLRPLRSRIYGIILYEKPKPSSAPHIVKEWCMEGENSLDSPKYIKAIPPNSNHPGLLDLWGETGRSIEDIKWQLFAEAACSRLDPIMLKGLNPNLVLPVATLRYFNETGELVVKDWELKAFLATAITLDSYDVVRLRNLPSDPVDPRGIRLAVLYLRATGIMLLLSAACGYPNSKLHSTPCNFFDGKLFQQKYRSAMSMSDAVLCENKVSFLEQFHQSWSIIQP